MSKLDNHLRIKQMALGSVSLVALIASAYTGPALAAAPTQFIYGGGATFPERVYRDIMNCYGNHDKSVAPDKGTEEGLTAHICNVGDGAPGTTAPFPYKPAALVLYAGVGSGNGKLGWMNHDAGNVTGNGYTKGGRVPDSVPVAGTVTQQRYHNGTPGFGSTWAATKGTNNPFPTVAFSGSDDPLLYDGTDLVGAGKYNANGVPNNWGKAIQVPAFTGTVTLTYNSAPGWNGGHGAAVSAPIIPAGSQSDLNLRTNTWCGIMTRAITDWNNAEITADNGGISITGGVSQPIEVVVRGDGSGTTFLMANAFITQCDDSAHPVPASWQTANGGALGTNVSGVSNNNWFRIVNAAFPGTFTEKPGNNGIRDYIKITDSAIGYVSTDFALPVDAGGSPHANLETYASHAADITDDGLPNNSTAAVFKQANKTTGAAIMAGLLPPSFTAGSCPVNVNVPYGTSYDTKCAHNAVNWGAVSPAPGGAGAYPIGGFTFYFMYTCYATKANGGLTPVAWLNASTTPNGFFRWYYGTTGATKVNASLNKNGFAAIPANWKTAVNTLLFTDAKTKLAVPSTTAAAGSSCKFPALAGTKGA